MISYFKCKNILQGEGVGGGVSGRTTIKYLFAASLTRLLKLGTNTRVIKR